MKKILLIHPLAWFGSLVDLIHERNPTVTVTANLEQTLAQIRAGEVSRVCIVFSTASASSGDAVRQIHGIDPLVPVLILDGDFPKEPKENERYVNGWSLDSDQYQETISEFFKDS